MISDERLHIVKRPGYYLVLDPAAPNWLATDRQGAWILRQLQAGVSRDEICYRFARRAEVDLGRALHLVGRFCEEAADFISQENRPAYPGRASCLQPARLRELWLHMSDRCNLTCRHCLVSSGPKGEMGLPTEELRGIIRQACELGAETFYFTGGEPLLRADIVDLLREVTVDHGATAVILTNGTLLDVNLTTQLAQLTKERLFLQVSLDGSTWEKNDALRSPGSFEGALRGIRAAINTDLNVTVAMVVMKNNLEDLQNVAELVRGLGVRQLHLMWQHVRERGAQMERPAQGKLIAAVTTLMRRAKEINLVIDNIENIKQIVNGDPHIKYDLSNACWDSLAIYRDGRVFPSACLVGIESECAGSLRESSLEDIWLNSKVCASYRARSVIDSSTNGSDPWIFLHGGGDPEQAFFASHENGSRGLDPYLPLYKAIAQTVIDDIVAERKALIGLNANGPVVYHKMGEDGYGCPIEAGVHNGGAHRVDFVHSNCVLIEDVVAKARAQVKAYYGSAAREPKTEICSPVAIDRRYLSHIPDEVVARSYGCGSPIFKAELQPGETLVDLGSGAGLECFIASRLVGEKGRVIGIDMTQEMLEFSNGIRPRVAKELGYDNVNFVYGLLEMLPLSDEQAEAVVSNCVINLSPEKLRVFAEIRRVLKPGGRLIISDIVSHVPLPPKIRFNPRLRGECIAGAFTESKLLRMLEKLGFANVEVLERKPWREVEEVPFDAITVRAWKPSEEGPAVSFCYPGPFCAVTLDSGQELLRGVSSDVLAARLPPVMNGHHEVTKGFGSKTIRHGEQAEATLVTGASAIELPATASRPKQPIDCMVCGEPLSYLEQEEQLGCYYCGRVLPAAARCVVGHFVCDQCHTDNHIEFIKSFCLRSTETDPLALFTAMRSSHLFPMHGPEHHALTPAAFLTAYRNRFGELPQKRIEAAIERGGRLPGGTCGSWGGCSAALGIGIAYATILNATPLSFAPRGTAQMVVSKILSEIGKQNRPRCCRRESYLSLQLGCELSDQYLPHELTTAGPPPCDQVALNRECAGRECPFSGRD